MTDTVFARGVGGALFELDVPKSGHALERWEEAIRKGDAVATKKYFDEAEYHELKQREAGADARAYFLSKVQS